VGRLPRDSASAHRFYQSHDPGDKPTNRRLQIPTQPHAISHDAAANPGLTEGTINV
jgi:hypothetical protein